MVKKKQYITKGEKNKTERKRKFNFHKPVQNIFYIMYKTRYKSFTVYIIPQPNIYIYIQATYIPNLTLTVRYYYNTLYHPSTARSLTIFRCRQGGSPWHYIVYEVLKKTSKGESISFVRARAAPRRTNGASPGVIKGSRAIRAVSPVLRFYIHTTFVIFGINVRVTTEGRGARKLY